MKKFIYNKIANEAIIIIWKIFTDLNIVSNLYNVSLAMIQLSRIRAGVIMTNTAIPIYSSF